MLHVIVLYRCCIFLQTSIPSTSKKITTIFIAMFTLIRSLELNLQYLGVMPIVLTSEYEEEGEVQDDYLNDCPWDLSWPRKEARTIEQ